jgi:hypothetical protein
MANVDVIVPVILVTIAIYFVPSFVAAGRNHRNLGALFTLNLLLGWTVLGWIGALVWSLVNPRPA